MPNVMVDLETLGLRPDTAPIIQISAVKFELDGAVDPHFFKRSVAPWFKRAPEQGALNWWRRSKLALLNQLLAEAAQPQDVFQEFASWVGYAHDEPLLFWAKPVHFDFPLVQGYFQDLGIPSPFHYRNTRDVRTYVEAVRRGKPMIEESDLPFDGIKHDAIFDVLHQIKWLQKAVQNDV